MRVQPPEGWQPLIDFCRRHDIPYQRGYRRVAHGDIESQRIGGHLFIRKYQSVLPFLAQLPKSPVLQLEKEPTPIYLCGDPRCILDQCIHKKDKRKT